MDSELIYKLLRAVLGLLSVYACTSYLFLGRTRSLGSYRKLRAQSTDILRPASVEKR